MEVGSKYDYSTTLSFIEPFVNLYGGEPFIFKMPESYGMLWQFKEYVASWSFGLNWFMEYVYI